MQHWFITFYIICLHLLHLTLSPLYVCMYPSICIYMEFTYIMLIYFRET